MSHTDVELSVGVRTLDLRPAVLTPTLAFTSSVAPLELRAAAAAQLTTSVTAEAS